MANLMGGSVAGRFYISSGKSPGIVSLLVNYHCNLACKHCYLENAKGRPLQKEEWNKIFFSLLNDLKPGALAFAGKEVFINKESVNLLIDAIKLKEKLNNTATELHLITNGTLVHKYKDILLEHIHKLSSFDVSLEGPKEINDFIRGKGSFEKATKNIKWLTREIGPKLWVTPTITSFNVKHIAKTVDIMHNEYDVQNFSLGSYRPRVGSKQVMSLYDETMIYFMTQEIRKFAHINTTKKVTVILDVDSHIGKFIPFFEKMVGQKMSDSPFAKLSTQIGNVTFIIKRTNASIGFWNAIRVDPQGNWASAEDLMKLPFQPEVAVASLRSLNYNTSKAYQLGLDNLELNNVPFSAKVITTKAQFNSASKNVEI